MRQQRKTRDRRRLRRGAPGQPQLINTTINVAANVLTILYESPLDGFVFRPAQKVFVNSEEKTIVTQTATSERVEIALVEALPEQGVVELVSYEPVVQNQFGRAVFQGPWSYGNFAPPTPQSWSAVQTGVREVLVTVTGRDTYYGNGAGTLVAEGGIFLGAGMIAPSAVNWQTYKSWLYEFGLDLNPGDELHYAQGPLGIFNSEGEQLEAGPVIL